MIDRSFLRPSIRHKSQTLTTVYRLVLEWSSFRYVNCSLSENGSYNARIANIMLNAIPPFVYDRCILTGPHNIVRLDPLLSLELLLHPSNLMKDLFRYASRINASFFVGSVPRVVSDYGRSCHKLGSSICLSLTDIKALCLAEYINSDNCDCIIILMQNWLSNILKRSFPDIQIRLDDVINWNIEVEVVLAFLFVIRSTRCIYDDIVDLEEVKKIDHVVRKLWEILFSRSTEYGGPVFCMFKLAHAMSIVKGALLFSSVVDGVRGTNYGKWYWKMCWYALNLHVMTVTIALVLRHVVNRLLLDVLLIMQYVTLLITL